MTDGKTFVIEHVVEIAAPPGLVFRYFTDPERLARWMGAGSVIGGAVGDAVAVALPGGARAAGRVVELEEPTRLVFSWGHAAGVPALPPGASKVEVVFEDRDGGTCLRLRHILPVAAASAGEDAAWRCHAARLAARAAREALGEAVLASLDAWTLAWRCPVEDVHEALGRACTEDVSYIDDTFSGVDRDTLLAHVLRCRAQMPGVVLALRGDTLSCGDVVTCSARMVGPGGQELGGMRLVARVAPDGRLRRMTALLEQGVPGVTPGAVLSAGSGGDVAPAGEPTDCEDGPRPGTADARCVGVEPHVWCADLGRSRRFYVDGLGFAVRSRFPGEGEPTWLQLARDGVSLMLAAPPRSTGARAGQEYLDDVRTRLGGGGGAVSLYLSVDDADRVLEQCRRVEAAVVEPIWEPFWGGRQFTVEDPDRNLWTVSGPVRGGGAGSVPPG